MYTITWYGYRWGRNAIWKITTQNSKKVNLCSQIFQILVSARKDILRQSETKYLLAGSCSASTFQNRLERFCFLWVHAKNNFTTMRITINIQRHTHDDKQFSSVNDRKDVMLTRHRQVTKLPITCNNIQYFKIFDKPNRTIFLYKYAIYHILSPKAIYRKEMERLSEYNLVN